jgi:hypothetical protein
MEQEHVDPSGDKYESRKEQEQERSRGWLGKAAMSFVNLTLQRRSVRRSGEEAYPGDADEREPGYYVDNDDDWPVPVRRPYSLSDMAKLSELYLD